VHTTRREVTSEDLHARPALLACHGTFSIPPWSSVDNHNLSDLRQPWNRIDRVQPRMFGRDGCRPEMLRPAAARYILAGPLQRPGMHKCIVSGHHIFFASWHGRWCYITWVAAESQSRALRRDRKRCSVRAQLKISCLICEHSNLQGVLRSQSKMRLARSLQRGHRSALCRKHCSLCLPRPKLPFPSVYHRFVWATDDNKAAWLALCCTSQLPLIVVI
jgi:hypothetical protein